VIHRGYMVWRVRMFTAGVWLISQAAVESGVLVAGADGSPAEQAT